MKLLYFFAIASLLLFFNQTHPTPCLEDFIQDIRYLYDQETTNSEDEKSNAKLVFMHGMERFCKQYMQEFQRIMSAGDFKETFNWSLTFFLFKYAREGKINDLQELIKKFPNLKLDPIDGNGKTPADHARDNGYADCLALLKSQTIDHLV